MYLLANQIQVRESLRAVEFLDGEVLAARGTRSTKITLRSLKDDGTNLNVLLQILE